MKVAVQLLQPLAMGGFLKFLFLILATNLGFGISLESSSLAKILSDPSANQSNLTSCLLSVVRDLSATYIGIRIESESKREFQDAVDGLFKFSNEVAINLDFKEQKDYNVDCWFYFIDSVKSLDLLVKRQRQQDDYVPADEQNFILILSVNIFNPKRMLMEIFQLCFTNFILNVNVLVEDGDGTITLYTYFPFGRNNCKNVMPHVHNRFQNGHFELKKKTFPSKTSNFWQCPLRAIFFELPPYITIKENRISGADVDFLEALATLLNFTLDFIAPPEGRGDVYANKTFTGSFKLLHDKLGDFETTVATIDRYKQFLGTSELYFLKSCIVVKRLNTYSPLEILLFPFDMYTWIGILVIFVGKFSAQLLCGRFMNNSVAPSEHFKRFCLALWLLSVLIFSSSYGGAIFKLLENRPDRPLPNTIAEAVNQGYKLVVPKLSESYVAKIPELKNNLITVNSGFGEAFNYFDSLEGKYGFLMWEDSLQTFVRGDRLKEFFFLPNSVTQNVVCIYMPKYFYLAKEINKCLQKQRAHGFIQKIFTPKINKGLETFDGRHESLTLQKLLGSFQLLCTLIAISTGVFFVELISENSPRLRNILNIID